MSNLATQSPGRTVVRFLLAFFGLMLTPCVCQAQGLSEYVNAVGWSYFNYQILQPEVASTAVAPPTLWLSYAALSASGAPGYKGAGHEVLDIGGFTGTPISVLETRVRALKTELASSGFHSQQQIWSSSLRGVLDPKPHSPPLNISVKSASFKQRTIDEINTFTALHTNGMVAAELTQPGDINVGDHAYMETDAWFTWHFGPITNSTTVGLPGINYISGSAPQPRYDIYTSDGVEGIRLPGREGNLYVFNAEKSRLKAFASGLNAQSWSAIKAGFQRRPAAVEVAIGANITVHSRDYEIRHGSSLWEFFGGRMQNGSLLRTAYFVEGSSLFVGTSVGVASELMPYDYMGAEEVASSIGALRMLVPHLVVAESKSGILMLISIVQ